MTAERRRYGKAKWLFAGALAAAVASAGIAQERRAISPLRSVIKTLLASEAQKECLSLGAEQRLYYRYRADGPLDFKLSHQEDDAEAIDVRRDALADGAGSLAPKRGGDYCLVWSNTGHRAVTLHYEFQRGPR